MTRVLAALLLAAAGLTAAPAPAASVRIGAAARPPVPRPPLPVTLFGARPDDDADDTAAIQAGVDALRPGQALSFPPGVYRIRSDRGVRLKDDVHLRLGEAVLTGENVRGARCRLFEIQGSRNIVISGGTLVGSRVGAPDWGVGILASDAEDLVIEDMVLRDFFFDGILLTGNRGCKRVIVRRVLSENNRRTGLAIPSASDVTVEDSVFRGSRGQSPEAGVNCEPGPGASVSKLRFVRDTFVGNAGVGLYIHRALGVEVFDAQVTGSRVENNQQGIIVASVDDVLIAGNRVSGHRGRARSGIAVGEDSKAIRIIGNDLQDNFRGITSAGATNVTIQGNVVVGTAPPFTPGESTDGDGIVCRGLKSLLADACVIEGNTVRRVVGSGIVTQLVSRVRIVGNTVEETGQRSIHLLSTLRSEVRDNRVATHSGEAPGRIPAIELANSSNENLIANNVIRGSLEKQNPVAVGAGCRDNEIYGNVTVQSDAGPPVQSGE
jgi:nitrous oxidase accessory protein NosD